jgi:D-threo-aldose 1-dehydrogenase
MTMPELDTRRRVGRTDLRIGPIGFGGTGIGNLFSAVSDEVADAAIEAAWGCGVRYFDTAPLYGLGLSEVRLGRALGRHPRGEYVLSTKVGRAVALNPSAQGGRAEGLFDVPDDRVAVRDYSADGVRRSLEASLDRLGTDRVDIVLVHDPDDHLEQTVTEAIPALVRLREEGVVRAIGAGMNQWQALRLLVERCDLDVVMVAGRWTLLDRSAAPLLDECVGRGVSVLAAAPYNSGLLARDEPPADATFDYAQASPHVLARTRQLADTSREHGLTLPTVALQFPLLHPAVVSVVTGVATAEEARAGARRMSTPVPAAFWSALAGRVHER